MQGCVLCDKVYEDLKKLYGFASYDFRFTICINPKCLLHFEQIVNRNSEIVNNMGV
jgi:hypothetical protein